MKLTSPNFENNQSIPSKFTCQGENVSPELNIIDIPEKTESMVLIIDDPDAPNGNWVHWLVWNIPASTRHIPANVGPLFSVQGLTSFNKSGYGGPCPPSGIHRYFFKLYALDNMLDLPLTTKKSDLWKAMENHILAETELMGTYQKF